MPNTTIQITGPPLLDATLEIYDPLTKEFLNDPGDDFSETAIDGLYESVVTESISGRKLLLVRDNSTSAVLALIWAVLQDTTGVFLAGPAMAFIEGQNIITLDQLVEHGDLEWVGGGGNESCLGVGTVLVNQDYGGTNALCYTINGQAIEADLLIYRQSDYDAGNRSKDYVVARTRQRANGKWDHTLRLFPGEYYLHFYSYNVAGPDNYPLTVVEE